MKRRNFIKNIGAGVALPSLVGGFGVRAYASSPIASLAEGLSTDTDHVLVLIQLAGGNDGLHTAIPLDQYDRLYKGRPNIILPEKSVLALTGTDLMGFHPAMTGMRKLYNEGDLRVVQNVGYAEQSYSHFRSSDIWMSGSASEQYFPSGWAGRYLSYEYPNYPAAYPNEQMPHPLSIEIGYSLSLNLMGPQTGMGFVISDADSFYKLVEGVQDPAPNTPAGEQLSYIRLVARQSRAYAKSIVEAAEKVSVQKPYPDTELAAKLKVIARLIAGGLKTRVYMTTLDGFDTHDFQVEASDHTLGAHANLLRTLSDAVEAFVADCAALGIANRVSGMTFSEFGRRIADNASVGTDHGEAAPVFLFGRPIAGGVSGKNPELPEAPTVDDNLPMAFDFRSLYATVLRDWFCVPKNDISGILLNETPFIDGLFQPNLACVPTSAHQANAAAGLSLIRCAPNPFLQQITIQYRSQGGPLAIQVLDAGGRVVATPLSQWTSAGEHTLDWDAADLPAGTYFFRLINGAAQQTKMAVKK